jgi:hypothetical protein
MVKKITPGPDTDAVTHPIETKAILAHMMLLALTPADAGSTRVSFLSAFSSAAEAHAAEAHTDPTTKAAIYADVQALCRRAALIASGPGPMERVRRPEAWFDAPERTETELTAAYQHAIEACNFSR